MTCPECRHSAPHSDRGCPEWVLVGEHTPEPCQCTLDGRGRPLADTYAAATAFAVAADLPFTPACDLDGWERNTYGCFTCCSGYGEHFRWCKNATWERTA